MTTLSTASPPLAVPDVTPARLLQLPDGAIILLRVSGWEGSDVKREHLDRLVQTALTRATA